MARMIIIVLVAGLFVFGCDESKVNESGHEVVMAGDKMVVWVEGEDYLEGPVNEEVGISAKLPASGGKVLYGPVLEMAGGYAVYEVKLTQPLADAKMLIRYARHHWREMGPSEVDVILTCAGQEVKGRVVLDKTGGWGTNDKKQWAMVVLELGDLAAGDWTVRFDAGVEELGSINMDGFFIVPGDVAITTAELSEADRIDITGERYVGVSVPGAIIDQRAFKTFTLPGRGFQETKLNIKVSLLDEKGSEVTVLMDGVAILGDAPGGLAVGGKELKTMPDGLYVIRTQWAGAPVMDVPVFFVGELAAAFDERFAVIEGYAKKLATSDNPAMVVYAADYEHAVAFVAESWEKVQNGTADRDLLAGIRRTLDQYEQVVPVIEAGGDPYEARFGDLRRAFRSEATGMLEQYRIFVPNSYRKDGKTPLLVALNHHENKFLDQADGVVREIAEQRGWMILVPGTVGTDEATAVYWDEGIDDLAQLYQLTLATYPGIDRSRIYCTGTSRGGFGTYNFAVERPDYFAAIACSSGVGIWEWDDDDNRTLVERYAQVPTLILHGGIDTLVVPEIATTVAGKLKEQGIKHELHIFPSYGHSYENYAEQYLTMSLDFFDRYRK